MSATINSPTPIDKRTAVAMWIDGPQYAPPEVAALWEELGVMAWSIAYNMQMAEEEDINELWWDKHCPINGEEPDDDESIDMGPDEPDNYGGTDFD